MRKSKLKTITTTLVIPCACGIKHLIKLETTTPIGGGKVTCMCGRKTLFIEEETPIELAL